jgi:predicted transcriptional regulator
VKKAIAGEMTLATQPPQISDGARATFEAIYGKVAPQVTATTQPQISPETAPQTDVMQPAAQPETTPQVSQSQISDTPQAQTSETIMRVAQPKTPQTSDAVAQPSSAESSRSAEQPTAVEEKPPISEAQPVAPTAAEIVAQVEEQQTVTLAPVAVTAAPQQQVKQEPTGVLNKQEKKMEALKAIMKHLRHEGYPGREKLAEVCGISLRSVDRYLAELQRDGIVQKDGSTYFLTAHTIEQLEH